MVEQESSSWLSREGDYKLFYIEAEKGREEGKKGAYERSKSQRL